MGQRYGKLVRDLIPAIIQGKGETCRWRAARPEELPSLLCAKVREETEELVAALDMDAREEAEMELADLLEALDAVIEAAGVDERSLSTEPKPRRGALKREAVALLRGAAVAFGDAFLGAEDARAKLLALYPAIDTVVFAWNLRPEQVQACQRDKRKARGGFAGGIVLEEA